MKMVIKIKLHFNFIGNHNRFILFSLIFLQENSTANFFLFCFTFTVFLFCFFNFFMIYIYKYLLYFFSIYNPVYFFLHFGRRNRNCNMKYVIGAILLLVWLDLRVMFPECLYIKKKPFDK